MCMNCASNGEVVEAVRHNSAGQPLCDPCCIDGGPFPGKCHGCEEEIDIAYDDIGETVMCGRCVRGFNRDDQREQEMRR